VNGVKYVDGFDYSSIKEPLTQCSDSEQCKVDDILEKYQIDDSELKEEIHHHISNEIKNATLEFISRFFQRLGQGSKLGYAVCRALGIHIYLKDKDGNEIKSLTEISKVWGCSPQLIDQLCRSIKQDIDLEPIENLAIEKKNYSYKVHSPDGYMTTGEVLTFLDISNKKLNGVIKRLGIKKRQYTRGSKLISEDDVDRIELYLMEGVEEQTTLGAVETKDMGTDEN
jgi:hypothetical protein